MKKYFYLLAAGLLLLCTGRAQIKKGESLLGGSVGFMRQDYNAISPGNGNATYVNVQPSFGKAIKDNLVVGVNLYYSYSKLVEPSDATPIYTVKQPGYGLGFFVRGYKDLGRSFSMFLEGDLGGMYSLAKGSYEGVNELSVDNKGYSINASLSAGIAYHITPRWMVETGFQNLAYINYGHTKYGGTITSVGGRQKESSFSLGTNLNKELNNFAIGCRYILN
ncbi:MAG TPA: hypothetical protein VHD83_18560 [Puia sp.]|nr:hypothetical protein [Puia sp.]